MSYKISAIKAFTDNYIWSISNKKHALVVDPGDAKPVLAFLDEHALSLEVILITHHHYDHTGGIAKLVERYPNVRVYGPYNPIIGGITDRLSENDTVHITEFDLSFDILQTPGHTLDHIVYVNSNFMFCGDTLFSGGCGRMFEGTPEVFHASLQKLASLPPNTKVYCTHEYTQANLQFALSIEPKNEDLLAYHDWVVSQRKRENITLPSSIKKECAINPFLRCHNTAIKQSLFNTENSTIISDVETFAKLRKLKDNF
jgi:hydroxyacylglutathione hydrolase